MIPEIVNANKTAYTKVVATEIIVSHDNLTLDVVLCFLPQHELL